MMDCYYELDLLVEDQVVVEIKSVAQVLRSTKPNS